MINNFEKDTCIAPRHLVLWMCENGYSKHLSLFLSMKRLYKSNHIHWYKTLDLSLLGYPISRKTYIKYIKVLDELKLLSITDNSLVLVGMQKMIAMVETTNKIKFSYIPNDKDIRNNLEKIVIQTKIKSQNIAIRSNHRKRNKERTTLIKTVRGDSKECNIVLSDETSLTCLSVAKSLGFKSKATGYKREVQFAKEKFIDKNHREINLGKLSKEIITARRSNGEILIGSSFVGYRRILSNEITLRSKVGLKPQPNKFTSFADAFGQF